MNLCRPRGLLFILSGLAFAALPACRQTGSGGPVVARVGDQKITLDDVKARLHETPSAYQQYTATADGRRQFLNLLIREKVLLTEANRLGIPKDPAYKSAVEKFTSEWQRRLTEYKETLLVESALRRLRATDFAVTDSDVEKYYNDHSADYQRPVEVQASHILVPTEEDAQKALDRLHAGESFDRVAKEMSKDPTTAPRGGKLSPFRRGSLVPEFEDAAFRLKVGQTSGIVKTQFGFHIIKKLGERQLPARPFSDVKEEIRALLEREKFNQWVTAKQTTLGVQVDEKAMSLLSVEEPTKP